MFELALYNVAGEDCPDVISKLLRFDAEADADTTVDAEGLAGAVQFAVQLAACVSSLFPCEIESVAVHEIGFGIPSGLLIPVIEIGIESGHRS
ncbi:hypothetical protein OE699_10415 [Sedimentimonas flavescens]|uniref:Uncharacterized protein n=1 Tax=Sedimentimonas flavescens TaxID=2851012 RepID=A0ABT3A119_9RHOB|nr:hypothetical protein [Sedimentimonas flavescens]MCV2879270.1 hypothetical protein [Sedimentimonas flavescens]